MNQSRAAAPAVATARRSTRDSSLRCYLEPADRRPVTVTGAAASALLVIPSTVWAAAPFLVIEFPWWALRVFDLLLLGALFAVGYQWGGYSYYTSRWCAGLVFLAVGLGLVGTAIALGG